MGNDNGNFQQPFNSCSLYRIHSSEKKADLEQENEREREREKERKCAYFVLHILSLNRTLSIRALF